MAALTYENSGVNIDAGNTFAQRVGALAKTTHSPQVLSGIGGFAGLFEVPTGYTHPVLVSGTDGVGTKLKIAMELGQHSTVGIDLVAMCVNDILAVGARPLFFLDYLATGKLNVDEATEVATGIVEGCRQASCALIGGETAELPGFYPGGEYDLAGFVVGIAERDALWGPHRVKPGDIIVGLPSTGLHSNGFSLARNIVRQAGWSMDHMWDSLQHPLGHTLLTPTKIYTPVMDALFPGQPQAADKAGASDRDHAGAPLPGTAVRAAAHITGGGLPENLPRVIPQGMYASIQRQSLEPIPPLFKLLQDAGSVAEEEMFRTFNMGIGFTLIVDPAHKDTILEKLQPFGPRVLGAIENTTGSDAESRVTFL